MAGGVDTYLRVFRGEQKRLLCRPAPDYSGMTLEQRINAKCALAKATIDKMTRYTDGAVRNEEAEVLHRDRVQPGGWTRLGLNGSAG